MDVVTITDKVDIDLDNMSLEELKKVVKHLYYKVQSLSVDLNAEKFMSRGISYGGGNRSAPF